MRAIKEIEADIEFLREDLKALRAQGSPTSVAMYDLFELFDELEEAKKAGTEYCGKNLWKIGRERRKNVFAEIAGGAE